MSINDRVYHDETEALDRMRRRAHNACDSGLGEERMMQCTRRVFVTSGERRAWRAERAEEWDIQKNRHDDNAQYDFEWMRRLLKEGKAVFVRNWTHGALNAHLARLSPCYEVVAAGHRKRLARAGRSA